MLIFNGFMIFSNLSRLYETKYDETKKICLCVIGKSENRYIKEFIEYYKDYGVDKLFLYDNNNIKGEKFENIIKNYIESGFVEIKNYRDIPSPQMNAFNDCYQKNSIYYNWLLFFDIDEYIYLKDFYNIKLYLNDKMFNKCESIQLNYVFHTDNNLIYYDNRTLIKRFPEKELKFEEKNRVWHRSNIKTMIRGNISNIVITNPHYLTLKIKSCNSFGKKINTFHLHTLKPDYKYYYVNHYYYKSLEEFIEKVMKTDAFHSYDISIRKIKRYFKYNKITKEKLDFIENRTHFDLSEFRAKLKKK